MTAIYNYRKRSPPTSYGLRRGGGGGRTKNQRSLVQAHTTILVNGQNDSGTSPKSFLRGSDGAIIHGTKLFTSEIPITFSYTALEAALIKGLDLRSWILMEEARDRQEKLAEWLSGRQFVFIHLSKFSMEHTIDVGPFKSNCLTRSCTRLTCASNIRIKVNKTCPLGTGM